MIEEVKQVVRDNEYLRHVKFYKAVMDSNASVSYTHLKLLYFTQRECLVQLGEPMFGAKFKAWKYGPVILLSLIHILQMYTD